MEKDDPNNSASDPLNMTKEEQEGEATKALEGEEKPPKLSFKVMHTLKEIPPPPKIGSRFIVDKSMASLIWTPNNDTKSTASSRLGRPGGTDRERVIPVTIYTSNPNARTFSELGYCVPVIHLPRSFYNRNYCVCIPVQLLNGFFYNSTKKTSRIVDLHDEMSVEEIAALMRLFVNCAEGRQYFKCIVMARMSLCQQSRPTNQLLVQRAANQTERKLYKIPQGDGPMDSSDSESDEDPEPEDEPEDDPPNEPDNDPPNDQNEDPPDEPDAAQAPPNGEPNNGPNNDPSDSEDSEPDSTSSDAGYYDDFDTESDSVLEILLVFRKCRILILSPN